MYIDQLFLWHTNYSHKILFFEAVYDISSGYEVRPINDLLRSHGCIRLVVSLIAVQVFFWEVGSTINIKRLS